MTLNRTTLAITTPTGNSGQHVLQTALDAGASVRVLVRDPAKLADGVREQCDIVQGELQNWSDLARFLDGAEGAFFCVPQSPEPDDILAYYGGFAQPFADAAHSAGVRRIVTISGGDGSGSGFRGVGQALHNVEEIINQTGIAARHVRCGYFMENFFWMAEPIARMGMFALPVGTDVPIPFVAARDIGIAAGKLLLDTSWSGQEGIAAHGPTKMDCNAAAKVASDALGFPVRFQPITGEQYKASIAPHGVSDALGQSLVEMFEAIRDGQDMGATPAARTARQRSASGCAAVSSMPYSKFAARRRDRYNTRMVCRRRFYVPASRKRRRHLIMQRERDEPTENDSNPTWHGEAACTHPGEMGGASVHRLHRYVPRR